MPIYDGLVSLADNDIPVIVELDAFRVRLSAAGTEIGEWPTSECTIRHLGNATYAISAESETLEFVPSQPTLFAAAIDSDSRPAAAPAPTRQSEQTRDDVVEVAEAPPPRLLTLVLFYVLCAATLAFATWALAEILL